jgi:hypothetical protein
MATVGLVVVGIMVGAGLVLVTLDATGTLSTRTVTQSLYTTTLVVTQTVTITVTVTPSATTVGQSQVTVTTINIPHSLSTTGLAAGCTIIAGTNGYVYLQNFGPAATTVNSLKFSYGGGTATVGLGGAACGINSGGAIYVQIAALNRGTPAAGEQFNGTFALSNGTAVPFSGAFT